MISLKLELLYVELPYVIQVHVDAKKNRLVRFGVFWTYLCSLKSVMRDQECQTKSL